MTNNQQLDWNHPQRRVSMATKASVRACADVVCERLCAASTQAEHPVLEVDLHLKLVNKGRCCLFVFSSPFLEKLNQRKRKKNQFY